MVVIIVFPDQHCPPPRQPYTHANIQYSADSAIFVYI